MTDIDNDVLHFEQRDNKWYLSPDSLAYGKPEQIREKKASHTRNLRPMEVNAFNDMKDVAHNLVKFRENLAIADQHNRGTANRLRLRRLHIAGLLTDDKEGT